VGINHFISDFSLQLTKELANIVILKACEIKAQFDLSH
jgi:hypothetical protein